MRLTKIFVIFCLATSVFASEKVGLDRIDAAVGVSSYDVWSETLMQKTAATGVKHIKIWVPWLFVDPYSPFEIKPPETAGMIVVPGIKTGGWHVYDVGALDAAVGYARRYGLEVTLGISGPPTWPRGNDCKYDLGTARPCGLINQTHFETFKNALFDFSYYMAERYPDVRYWLIYNEPNLPYAFLPERPYPGGSLLSAYMELVYYPMAYGIKRADPEAKMVGPEITLLNVNNEFGQSRWLEDWIEPILRDYPEIFDVLSVHTYPVDAYQALNKMESIRWSLSRYSAGSKKVWVTEFNFGTAKEPMTQSLSNLFSNLLVFYSNQWWERSYFFTTMGHLLGADENNFGKELPLFPLFQKLTLYLP